MKRPIVPAREFHYWSTSIVDVITPFRLVTMSHAIESVVHDSNDILQYRFERNNLQIIFGWINAILYECHW